MHYLHIHMYNGTSEQRIRWDQPFCPLCKGSRSLSSKVKKYGKMNIKDIEVILFRGFFLSWRFLYWRGFTGFFTANIRVQWASLCSMLIVYWSMLVTIIIHCDQHVTKQLNNVFIIIPRYWSYTERFSR